MRTARLELRPTVEGDLDALVELDGFDAVRDTIDPFGDHIPVDAVQRREYERRLVGNAGYVAAVERASGRLLGWFQAQLARDGSGELELGYRLPPMRGVVGTPPRERRRCSRRRSRARRSRACTPTRCSRIRRRCASWRRSA